MKMWKWTVIELVIVCLDFVAGEQMEELGNLISPLALAVISCIIMGIMGVSLCTFCKSGTNISKKVAPDAKKDRNLTKVTIGMTPDEDLAPVNKPGIQIETTKGGKARRASKPY